MGSTETDYREGGNYLSDRTPAYLPDRYDKVVLLQDGLDDLNSYDIFIYIRNPYTMTKF